MDRSIKPVTYFCIAATSVLALFTVSCVGALFESMSLLHDGAPYYSAEYEVTYTEGELREEIAGLMIMGGVFGVLTLAGLAAVLRLRRQYAPALNAPDLRRDSITVPELIESLQQESQLGTATGQVPMAHSECLGHEPDSATVADGATRASDDVAALWEQRRLLEAMIPSISGLLPDLAAREHATFETLLRRAREVEVLERSLASGVRSDPKQTARSLAALDALLAQGVEAHASLVRSAARVYAETLAAGTADAIDLDELRRTQERVEAIAHGLAEINAVNRSVLRQQRGLGGLDNDAS